MKEILKQIRDFNIIILQLIGLALTLISNSVSLILPNQFAKLLDTFTQSNDISFNIIILLIISASAGLIVGVFQSYLSTYISESIGKKIRIKLIKNLLRQDYKYVIKETGGKLLTIFTADLTTVKEFLATGGITIASALFMLFGSLILMIQINSKLTLSIFAVVPLLIIAIFVIFKKAGNLFNESRIAQDKINKALDDNIKASMLIRVFTSEETENQKFNIFNINSKSTSLKIVNIFATLLPILTLFTGLITLLIAWIGGSQIISGDLSLGELTAFTTYVTIFTTPIFILGFMASSIGQTLNSANRISELLIRRPNFIQGENRIKNFNSLEFKDISFSFENDDKQNNKNEDISYKSSQKILKNLNFKINKGQKIGIVGSSGSGKSIILNLFMRFLEPIEGEILLNKKPIQSYKIADYRKLISYVPQENFIFNGTIRENILFGATAKITNNEFNKIVRICSIDNFSTLFPKGFDELTSEGGTTLSGGQKQRITLARALLHKPQILILDDSTSKLDINTEREILRAIENEYPDLTVIIVSQKISSIKNCDKIIVIDEGKITDIGKHEELIKKSLTYKEIELSQNNYGEF